MAKSDVKAPEKEVKATKSGAASKTDITVAEKLVELYRLQHIDSQVDKIRIQRGELPLEVQDLEDEVAGLETRMKKLQDELAEMETQVTDKQNLIKDAKGQIKKYEGQQAKVRNNREYDSLTKEVSSRTWRSSWPKSASRRPRRRSMPRRWWWRKARPATTIARRTWS